MGGVRPQAFDCDVFNDHCVVNGLCQDISLTVQGGTISIEHISQCSGHASFTGTFEKTKILLDYSLL